MKVWEAIVIPILSTLFAFMLIAFVFAEINPFMWDKDQRIDLILLSIGFTVFSGLLALAAKDKI